MLDDAGRIQLCRAARSGATMLEARDYKDIPLTLRELAKEVEDQAMEIERLRKQKKKAKGQK